MAGKRMEKKRKELAKQRAAKAEAMASPGYKSKYAQRFAARLRGEPVSGRGLEGRPWFAAIVPHE